MTSALPSQAIERFHLSFLAHLTRGTDKRAFVLKGGCNLRFFHHSIRYSEDMDLDVEDLDEHVLRDRVRAILASRSFAQALESRGMRIEHVTEHKQTPTVQRWKLGLLTERGERPLPTKIEFSRRGIDEGAEFGSVDQALVGAHGLAPFMVSHYGAAAALKQKVGALAHRTETQARDVFDVHHLLASGAPREAIAEIDPRTLEQARSRAAAIDFAVFKSQVLAYLQPDDQARYDAPDVWDTLVLEVLESLEAGEP